MAKKIPKTLKAPVTPSKARKILRDGKINGRPLTVQQKKFFGRIANGARRVKANKR